jgi:GNAT superfamily N-acetyltransferase
MSLRAVTITHAELPLHAAFLRYVSEIFPRISFHDWYRHGGWDDTYRVFALFEGERIVASASLTRMNVILNDRPVRGWQLGAVGTLPEHRMRGLQRQTLSRLLEHTGDDDLVYLFANHHVLDFYPRFGFTRAHESLFRLERTCAPLGVPLRTLELGKATDRELLQRIAHTAEPVTTRFGARDYGTVVLWYWSNFYPRGLRYAPEHDAIVVVEQSKALLRVYDVLAKQTFDLAALVPRLISAPISEIEFGFTPTRFAADAIPRADYTDSPLFVRGPHAMPVGPFKYPMLGQT